jgi:hypothetical protein
MKKRYCDQKDCKRQIEGAFYKVCRSTFDGKKLKLEHVADLCESCFAAITGNGP